MRRRTVSCLCVTLRIRAQPWRRGELCRATGPMSICRQGASDTRPENRADRRSRDPPCPRDLPDGGSANIGGGRGIRARVRQPSIRRGPAPRFPRRGHRDRRLGRSLRRPTRPPRNALHGTAAGGYAIEGGPADHARLLDRHDAQARRSSTTLKHDARLGFLDAAAALPAIPAVVPPTVAQPVAAPPSSGSSSGRNRRATRREPTSVGANIAECSVSGGQATHRMRLPHSCFRPRGRARRRYEQNTLRRSRRLTHCARLARAGRQRHGL
jgi:hypothetical protein